MCDHKRPSRRRQFTLRTLLFLTIPAAVLCYFGANKFREFEADRRLYLENHARYEKEKHVTEAIFQKGIGDVCFTASYHIWSTPGEMPDFHWSSHGHNKGYGGVIRTDFYNAKVTPKSLDLLAELEQLKTIEFSHCDLAAVVDDLDRFNDVEKVTISAFESQGTSTAPSDTKDVAYVNELSQVSCTTHVRLHGFAISREAITRLIELPRLNHLELSDCPVDWTTDHIYKPPTQLRRLSLRNMEVPIFVIRQITNWTWLEELEFRRCQADLAHIASLAHFVDLKELSLEDVEVSASLMHSISQLPKLQKLKLNNCRIDWSQAESLGSLTQLEELDLNGSNVIDENLIGLSELDALKSLKLSETDITDATLINLASLPGLETLHLPYTKITDVGGEFLGEHQSLKDLQLQYTDLTDQSIAKLSRLKKLEQLNLKRTKVTDAGLESFDLEDLFVVNLSGTAVTDRALNSIGKGSFTRHIYIAKTSIADGSEADLARINKRFHANIENQWGWYIWYHHEDEFPSNCSCTTGKKTPVSGVDSIDVDKLPPIDLGGIASLVEESSSTKLSDHSQ